jgi:predicted GNAT superfamily acetyltransferase
LTTNAAAARDRAEQDARAAVEKAGVTVRPLHTRDECVEAASLLAKIWGTSLEASPLSGDLLVSLIHSGACVLGAIDSDGIVGLTVGLGGPPQSDSLYSVIAGVDRGHANRGVGLALKQHQRVWALERGATRTMWTYDPMVRRNAHFNLNRLGARVTEYLPDFYPPMHDAINRGDLTDRLAVVWDLLCPDVSDAVSSEGVRVLQPDQDLEPTTSESHGEQVLLAWIPQDIEALRTTNRASAMRWRMALRETLQSTFEAGYRPEGVSADGYYVLKRQT